MKRDRLLFRDVARFRICGILMLVSTGLLVGCGDGTTKATAKVSGTVTANGKAVPGGEVVLAPIGDGKINPGKTTISPVDVDGTFTVSSYKEGDGAVIGKVKVSFNAPQEDSSAPPAGGHAAARTPPYAGMVPKEKEFEVKAGEDNILNIELVPGQPGAPPK